MIVDSKIWQQYYATSYGWLCVLNTEQCSVVVLCVCSQTIPFQHMICEHNIFKYFFSTCHLGDYCRVLTLLSYCSHIPKFRLQMSSQTAPDVPDATSVLLIRPADVPQYLQAGEYFHSLSEFEGDERIPVPHDTLKADTSICSDDDLRHLLTSLRYWGVSDVSNRGIRFF